MAIAELLRQIVSFLRYLGAPIVAVVVVWLSDEGHDILRYFGSTVAVEDRIWLLAAFVVVLGLVPYYAHRIVFHPAVTVIFVSLATWWVGVQAGVRDLAFARWRRRAAEDHTEERSVQTALDELNASAHFFYSSGWASLLLAGICELADPVGFSLNSSVFWPSALLLLAVGAAGDCQAALWDVHAFRRFQRGDA